jgi:glycyl-tRNA synthetase beta chain
VDAVARAQAVSKVRPSADFESISVAFKRMKNILRQAEQNGIKVRPEIELTVLSEVDKNLADQIKEVGQRFVALEQKREYEKALGEMSKLREPIDTFFDSALVMDPDERVRNNRLAILQNLLKSFSTIADFSEIVTEGKG